MYLNLQNLHSAAVCINCNCCGCISGGHCFINGNFCFFVNFKSEAVATAAVATAAVANKVADDKVADAVEINVFATATLF